MVGYESVCKNFSLAVGLGVTAIGKDGDKLCCFGFTGGNCAYCQAVNPGKDDQERCRLTPSYGSYQARRFNGRYIFFCHRGLAHVAAPVFAKGRLWLTLLCGPFLMVEHEDYLNTDVAEYHRRDSSVPQQEALADMVAAIPVIAPERVHALSEMLFCVAGYLARIDDDYTFDFIKDNPLPAVITDYIERLQEKGDTGFYPMEKEEELLTAMSRGDVLAAKSLLNDLLGYIFFYSGMRFDVIRSRVLELIVLLSRAAVRAGADAELIFGLNYEYLREIGSFNSIEDLSVWLSMIMNRFTDYVFHYVDVKHADIIYKAIDHIKTSYRKKVTLEDAARVACLSTSYFSRVFKGETGYAFTEYLNKVRIDESKKLLRNERINLADIAGLVGYEDQSYFSKVFKKTTGMSPLKYRQSRCFN